MSYYYNKGGKNNGPVSMEELKALAEKGEIGPKTPVIESGKKVWMKWEVLSQATERATDSAAHENPHPKMTRSGGLRPTSSRQFRVQRGEELPSGIMGFFDKVTGFYDKIDAFLTKICDLPEGIADTSVACEKRMRFLSAPVGVSTLLCVIFFCLASEVYDMSGKLTACILGAGCVLQYLCYQLYNAMIPLLLGKKIRLSSMRMPKVVAILCAAFILLSIWGATQVPELRVKDLFQVLIGIIFLAGVGYVCLNSQRLFVVVTPGDVVPGREMINLLRFILRATFTALHILTPVLMLLTAGMILTSGNDQMGFLSIDEIERAGLSVIGTVLPIITFFGFCLLSLIPDFMEALFAASDHNNNLDK